MNCCGVCSGECSGFVWEGFILTDDIIDLAVLLYDNGDFVSWPRALELARVFSWELDLL